MTHTARIPVWLWIAAAAMIIQDLAAFIVYPITAFSVFLLIVTVLLVWFLLHGSRVAWVLAILSLVAQLTGPLTLGQPVWIAGTAAILLACLLAPSSWTFVWGETAQPMSGKWPSVSQRLYTRLLALVDSVAQVVGFDSGLTDEEAVDKPRVNGRLILWLGACVLILVPLVGLLYDFHHGAGRDSVIVDILWRVVWVGYTFVRLALILLLVVAAYGYFTKRRMHKP